MKIASAIYLIVGKIKKKRYWNRFFSHQKNSFNRDKKAIREANRLGFTIDEATIYNLQKNNYHDYVREVERHVLRDKLSDLRILLDNKLVFYHLIKSYAPTNTIYGYKAHWGDFHWLDAVFDSPIDLIVKKGKVCFKKSSSGCGEGFHIVEHSDSQFLIDRKPATKGEVFQLLDSQDYFLEEFCIQSDFENALFPYAVNTIRIITLQEPNGEFRIVSSMHRFGSSGESVVDNASAGGLFSMIDPSTGRMDAALSYQALQYVNERDVRFTRHPVTGSQIEGVVIPNWQLIKDTVLDLHQRIGFCGLNFIAWDIAHTNDGPVIIEGNTTSSVDLLQANGGLRNGYLGDYYRRMGIIK